MLLLYPGELYRLLGASSYIIESTNRKYTFYDKKMYKIINVQVNHSFHLFSILQKCLPLYLWKYDQLYQSYLKNKSNKLNVPV
jgi:hypothetical protein